MLKRLYDWTISLAERPSAEAWLFVISFMESSVFMVPTEVLFMAMAIARRDRAWRYGAIAGLGSVLGGIAGWGIGYFAFDAVARPILEFYGKLGEFETLKAGMSFELVVMFLLTSGIAHIPPLKIVTILAGALHINFWVFAAAAIVARWGKFLLLAWLFARYGASIRTFVEQRLNMLAGGTAVIAVAAFGAYLAFR